MRSADGADLKNRSCDADAALVSSIPGWYPDPAGSPDLRYWDGQVWSEQTAPASAPAEAVAAAVTVAAAAPTPPAAAPVPDLGFFSPGPSPAAPEHPQMLGRIPTPRGGQLGMSGPQRLAPATGSKSGLSGRAIAAGLAAVVAAVGATVYLTNQHHGGPVRVSAHTTISMPSEVAGVPQIRATEVDELNRIMSGSAVPGPRLIGLYGTSANSPSAFMMVAKYPQTADQVQHNLSMSLRALDESVGNVVFWQTTDPGPLGGSMRCATVVQSAQSANICMFEDTDVVGVTFSVGTAAAPGVDPVTLRDAVEHRS
jgi:hypothetical protein